MKKNGFSNIQQEPSSRMEIYLSAFLLPGIGQFLQKNWLIVALFFWIPSQSGRCDPIHWAVKNNNLSQVEKILDEQDETAINARLMQGVTPLHIAAAIDSRQMTGLLISRGADVSSVTESGFTPLHWAAGKDAKDSAWMLVTMGADIEAATSKGITPLHWAAANNATSVVQLLINAGARTSKTTSNGMTPLHRAVSRGANEAAELLAYTKVSKDLAKGIMQGELTVQEARKGGPDALLPEEINEPRPLLPEPVPGKNLIIPIGFGESLEFVWIDDMKVWAGKYEITNGQYKRYDPEHSSLFYEDLSLDSPDQPVVYVTWNDAVKFCSWLNKNYHKRLPRDFRFRLPSKEEWETFAKCGTQRKYPWGHHMPPRYGNYSDITARKNISPWNGLRRYKDGYALTAPVTDSGVNEWGLYGVGGNVWEWCSEWYNDSRKYKIRKGASWSFDSGKILEVDYDGFDRPDMAYDTIGFRIVAAPEK